MNPPWQSKYTININTEMNYWPAESGNLAECVEPLIQMVKELSLTGARTAEEMYGARGWVAHHNTDLWRASGPIDGPDWGMWPTGGAWLTEHLWERYEFSGDQKYLKEIYPILRGAALFFLDTLVEEPKQGWLVTNPSVSPENHHPFGSAVCAGPAMDSQILRDLFARCIQASQILKTDADLRRQLEQARARLAPDQIGAQGQLQEWLEDWDARAPEQQHRHISHLYALYPSSQITPRGTRNSPRPPKSRSTSAATSPPAGPSPGASTVGRDCTTATAPSASSNTFSIPRARIQTCSTRIPRSRLTATSVALRP
jgi:alpha-L-fucosidase 2